MNKKIALFLLVLFSLFAYAPVLRNGFVWDDQALILRDPSSVESPFYLLFPHWSRLPMVFLATFATVIASQAVISGAFSVTFTAAT